MLNFVSKSFIQLTIKELHDLFALRSEVFVVEQNCVYQDIDGKDPKGIHILGLDNKEKIAAYARVLPKGESYSSYVSIGRLVVSKIHRGKNYGHDLVKKGIEEAIKLDVTSSIKISAQAHLVSFYNSHGFIEDGEGYLEDGIPHIAMTFKP
jgi:ElaA protein